LRELYQVILIWFFIGFLACFALWITFPHAFGEFVGDYQYEKEDGKVYKQGLMVSDFALVSMGLIIGFLIALVFIMWWKDKSLHVHSR
jgi:hypothetical protein